MATPKAGLKTMPTGTTKNEAVFNEGVILLEALAYRGVVSRSVLDPTTITSPAPANGTIYLVPDGSPNAVGDWASKGGQVAVYYDGWRYLNPDEGLTLWVTDEAQSIQYRSGVWIDRTEFAPIDPTRTTVTLSGASTSQAIPAGCTRFAYTSGAITTTIGTTNMSVELYSASDTVQELFSGWAGGFDTAASGSVLTASGLMNLASNEGSTTSRGMFGSIESPRDATKKTLSHGRSFVATVFRDRELIADTAADDDTIRFVAYGGATITGTVHIEWYYN